MKTLITSLAVMMTLIAASTASAQLTLGQRRHVRSEVRDVRRELRQAGVIVSPSERRESATQRRTCDVISVGPECRRFKSACLPFMLAQ